MYGVSEIDTYLICLINIDDYQIYDEVGLQISVLVSTDLSGKELHRQIGVVSMVTYGSLGGVMAITLTRPARNVGWSPDLTSISPIFKMPIKKID